MECLFAELILFSGNNIAQEFFVPVFYGYLCSGRWPEAWDDAFEKGKKTDETKR